MDSQDKQQAYIGITTKRKLPKAVKYVLIAILGAVVAFGGLVGWFAIRFYQADRAMDNEDYAKALEIYQSLDDDEGIELAEAYLSFVDAAELMDSGDYADALEALNALSGDYPFLWDTRIGELPDVIEECEQGVTLVEGREQYENGAYAAALDTLEALEDETSYFTDEARELADNSRDALARAEILPLIEARDYDRAVELLTTGYGPKLRNQRELLDEVTRSQVRDAIDAEAYERAAELLTAGEASRLSDSAQLLQEVTRGRVRKAMDAGDYERAVELLISEEGVKLDDQPDLLAEIARREVEAALSAGDYQAALSILGMKRGKLLPDHDELVTQCNNAIAYAEAVDLFNSELYYSAYKAFQRLGDFRDSAERAQKCVRDKPSTGQTYRNGNYSGSAVSLRIIHGSSSAVFFKIYKVSNGNEVHVSSVFLRAGSNATVNLPSGTYVFKAAYGSGNWYGSKEMFGDDGTYQKLNNIGGASTFTLQGGYGYELTLEGASNGNVGSTHESRSSF